MTRIKNFSDFDINEKVAVEKVSAIKVSKKLEDKIRETKELNDEIKKLSVDMEDLLKPLSKRIKEIEDETKELRDKKNPLEKEIIESLSALKIKSSRIGDFLVTLDTRTLETYPYKEIQEKAFDLFDDMVKAGDKLAKKMSKKLADFKESVKNVTDKSKLSIDTITKNESLELNEGLKEIWSRFLNWLGGWWKDLKGSIDSYVDSAEGLDKLTAEMVSKSTIKPTNEGFNSKLADKFDIEPEMAKKYPNGMQLLDVMFASSELEGIEDDIKGIISGDEIPSARVNDVLDTLESMSKRLGKHLI